MKERYKVTIISPEGKKEYWSDTPLPEIVEEQNRYLGCTEEELRALLRHVERREENDGLTFTETIIKIESALEKIEDASEEKEDSGIIYEAESPSPNRLDRT